MNELQEMNEDAQLLGLVIGGLTEALSEFAANLAQADDGENQ